MRRHQEDADTFVDELNMLCRCGYPRGLVEMRQELISEQFIRGQSDPKLQRHLWVVMRAQPDRNL